MSAYNSRTLQCIKTPNQAYQVTIALDNFKKFTILSLQTAKNFAQIQAN